MGKVTIMQMSDLHRTTSGFFSNKAFLSSIVSDIDRQKTEEEPISKPDMLVFCGDIIQGVNRYSNLRECYRKIQEQYNTAEDVLNKMCDSLFNNDKQKIVIVPGNHDVSWADSRRSMKKTKRSRNLAKLVSRGNSRYRWSWEDHSYYKISNLDLYRKRFVPFSEFYSSFYEGKRQYSLDPKDQYDVFEYPEWSLLVVGFNSCFGNDHLNHFGSINSECIADCHEKITQSKYDNWMKIAVWHHDIQGYPFRQDFMDERTLQFLIDKGFHVGLHGHNHKTDVLEVRFSADEQFKMLVFGCGSLGAPKEDIPLGESRHYALLELNMSDFSVRFHLRKAVDQPPELPIWMPGNISQNKNMSYIDGTLSNVFIKKRSRSILDELVEAEGLVSRKEYRLALGKMTQLDHKHPIVHRLMVECYWQLDMNRELIKFIKKPSSILEFTYLSEALWREKEYSKLDELIKKTRQVDKIASSEVFKRIEKKMRDAGYGKDKVPD